MGIATLDWEVRESVFKEVTFEQSPKGREEDNEVGDLGDIGAWQRKQQCKGPGVGTELIVAQEQGEGQ